MSSPGIHRAVFDPRRPRRSIKIGTGSADPRQRLDRGQSAPSSHGTRSRGPDRQSGAHLLRGPSAGARHDRGLQLHGGSRGDRAGSGDRRGDDPVRLDRRGAGSGGARRDPAFGLRGAPRQERDHERGGFRSALGKVVKVTAADLTAVSKLLSGNLSLAAGYNQLYQGQSNTGVSPGVDATVTGINNGNLSAVEGASQQPGSATATTAYLPPGTGPKFPSPHRGLVPGRLHGSARVTGRRLPVAGRLNRSTAWAGPTRSAPTRGSRSRSARSAGPVTVSRSILPRAASSPSVRTSSPAMPPSSWAELQRQGVIGDNVSIGNGAVVDRTSLGSGSTVGDRATC